MLSTFDRPYILAVFLLLAAWSVLFPGVPAPAADVIPPDRRIAWNPGVRGGISQVPVQVSLSAVDLSGAPDAAKRIQASVDAVRGAGAVLLPEGTFQMKSAVRLRSGVVLRGMGASQTRLIFNVPGQTYLGAICVRGQRPDQATDIVGGYTAGSTQITLASAAGLKPGDMLDVFCENDGPVMYTKPEWNDTWAAQSVGQMVDVVSLVGNTVAIEPALRLTYKKELKPRVRRCQPIVKAGIEDLYIKRLDKAEDFIIMFDTAADCWVRNIESEYCNRAHIQARLARNLTIEGNYFHHAWNYGGGGHGYGVNLATHASDCLITNNIFRSLRHSMIIQMGANGNVFSYNYSIENVKLCDISIHGHYPYMNLFEGNAVQFVQVADYWGPAGPLVTFFRNRVATTMNVRDHSIQTNVVGNTIGQGAVTVDPTCRGALVEGNRVNGKMAWRRPDGGGELPVSLYLKEKPTFWGDRPWPGIGADVDGTPPLTRLPAEERYRAMSTSK